MNSAERQARANIDLETLRTMSRASSATDIHDVWRGYQSSPSSIIPSGPSTPVRPATPVGWRPEIPIAPPPGINYVDRLVDAQDAKDKAQRIVEQARMKSITELAQQMAEQHAQFLATMARLK
jgi:hypothetical protein